MRALNTLLMHPSIASIEAKVVSAGYSTKNDHTVALCKQQRDWKSILPSMLENDVRIVAFLVSSKTRSLVNI